MNSLLGKLSLAWLALVLTLGGLFVVIERQASRSYHDELTQRLNAPIAMYVVEARTLVSGGVIDRQALEELAAQAMVVNPTVEVYLLDTAGRVVGHALPAGELLLAEVDIAPVHALLNGTATPPLRGDDPRDPATPKVFSAAQVLDDGRLFGYLYVILGGQKSVSLAQSLADSYVQRTSLLAIVLLTLGLAATGLIVFRVLTRRMRMLSERVQAYAQTDFREAAVAVSGFDGNDDIDRLGRLFQRMAQRIADQFERLQENDRLRRELIANVSHDLRTPLASMQGYIETLLIKDRTISPQERHRYLQIARKHTRRLNELVHDLFELSKLDARSVQPQFERFSIAELLQDSVQEFALQARQRDVELAFEPMDDAGCVVADIGLIQRVLENLIRNALAHTPPGGRITLAVSDRDEAIAVAIEDTGAGIREADIPRIFDRFYRARAGQESLSDSSGLGLAIVKKILDLHGSRITVASELDRGTRFEFELATSRRAA